MWGRISRAFGASQFAVEGRSGAVLCSVSPPSPAPGRGVNGGCPLRDRLGIGLGWRQRFGLEVEEGLRKYFYNLAEYFHLG